MQYLRLVKKGSEIDLDPMEQGHLKALRLKGEHTFSGLLGDELYEVVLVPKGKAYAVKEYVFKQKIPSSRWPALIAPLIDFKRLEWALEKCTEVGIARIFFYLPDFSSAGKKMVEQYGKKRERMQMIVSSAGQQSGNLAPPSLMDILSLKDWLAQLEQENAVLLVLDASATNGIKDIKSSAMEYHAVIVGPEGGFSADELELLRNFSRVHFMKIGQNILRSETAMLLGATMVAAK
jgi:16S rRNA (uracil1498-N3)-methyltransferase